MATLLAIVQSVLLFAAQQGFPAQEVEYVQHGQLAYVGGCEWATADRAGTVLWCPNDNKIVVMLNRE